MLFQVTQRGEYLLAHIPVAVECLAVVQTQMRSQAVSSVERLLTVRFGTLKRLDLVVNPHMDLETVAGEERLATILFTAFKLELALVRLDVCPQVAACTVVAVTRLINALVTWFLTGYKTKKQTREEN